MSDIKIPHRNFCSDLNLTSMLVTPRRSLMVAPLTEEIRSPDGGGNLGVLVTMVDVVVSDPVLVACTPDWTATQTLSLHSAKPLLKGPIVIDASLQRPGKKIITAVAEVYDGSGLAERALEGKSVEELLEIQALIDRGDNNDFRSPALTLVGRSQATFVRIPRGAASGMDAYEPEKWVGRLRTRRGQEPNHDALLDRIGLTYCDDAQGIVEIAGSPYVNNSIGTITGGVQAVVMQTAAECMCPGKVAMDVQIQYLSQLKVGPARTRGIRIRDQADHSVVLVELVDAGADDRLLTTAVITLL